MTERLTTGLEDGSIERLRELAGGERKVGAFLSQVTAWLWAHKEQLEAAPLSDYGLRSLKEISRTESAFANAVHDAAARIHANAQSKGWWDGDRNDGELIALCHSELSEALEALRQGNPADEHLPQFSSVEVELADVVIRILDMAAARGYRLGEAIAAKHDYNTARAYKHGGKVF